MARMKSSGRAKYSSDLEPKGLLFAAYLGSARTRMPQSRSIDTGAAEKSLGVKAVT